MTEISPKKFKIIKNKKSKWSEEEDINLLKIIEMLFSKLRDMSKIKWIIDVANNFTDKTSKQCYNRYRHINPNFQKGYIGLMRKMTNSKNLSKFMAKNGLQSQNY